MEKLNRIKTYMESLRLNAPLSKLEELMNESQKAQISYLDFTLRLLQNEIEYRQEKDLQRKLKFASLPKDHDLDNYDHGVSNGVIRSQLQQLRELLWLQQSFNLILMGPSGVGKTFIAAGLGYDALRMGYSVVFRSMQELITILKMKDIARSASIEYKKIRQANLVIIDDMMILPMGKEEANNLFQLINKLHEYTSVIVTTNKGPKEWAEVLQDEVLATAILDRLLFKCEIITLAGGSYRMANRKTIFKDKQKKIVKEEFVSQ
jgi:DNA replication protein DnaC